MKQYNRKTGSSGEDAAVGFLIKKGFVILERNFSNKFGEIDIIANDKSVLVFVEVKAKVGDTHGLPEEMVGKSKLQKIRRMATVYMGGEQRVCRIDVVAVVFGDEGTVTRLTHYENVY